MFGTILVAVDGSPISARVLSAAADLCRHYSSRLHLVYVRETAWPIGGAGPDPEEDNRVIAGFEEELARLGVTAIVHLKHGQPGEVIIGVSCQVGADLIVLGSIGKSGISRMLSGSVSTYVTTHSPVATLVIRP